MTRRPAAAKLNLALVVGSPRADGKHAVTTVLQRIYLSDRIGLEPAPRLEVDGFGSDTLVRGALTSLADAAGIEALWRAVIEKRIPVASGLGGGSSDAATALRLANETLADPLDAGALHALAAGLGADVPFFLATGPRLGEGDGSQLTALRLPQDYWVLIVLPNGVAKPSTGAVYRAFDERQGAVGYTERRERLLEAVADIRGPAGLAALPPNDLASSPLAAELRAAGAFRADVSGAGPAVYGLFQQRRAAVAAQRLLRRYGRTWITVPAWYF
jgi:4-diphosphocytidyl-2-C-methyl-D-erythritol kinase